MLPGKRPRGDTHTVLAAGGSNAALGTLDPENNWQIHAADTLTAGRHLGDPYTVELLCREAPRAVEEFVSYGVPLARAHNGDLSQRCFGAHRYCRTCFVGDSTDPEIIRALLREVGRREIRILERVYVSHLLTQSGRVNGALGFMLEHGRELIVHTGAVLLTIGGHIHIYHHWSSRRHEKTGDGMALAFGIGAPRSDMALMQFHPSGMLWPLEREGTLLSEAVRGEGGRLLNQQGKRFMARDDPAESCGAHQRRDCPATNPACQRAIVVYPARR